MFVPLLSCRRPRCSSESDSVLLHSIGPCQSLQTSQIPRDNTYNHEQMGEESILSKMVLPVIKMIFALLGFVCEVELGEFSKSTEAQHGKSTGQAGHSATTTFHSALKQLTMHIFHVLEYRDELMLGRCACDDTRLRQHVSTTSRFQLHLVHEVLYAVAIENAITVDEEHEQVIVAAKIILVYSVDKAECLLLTASFATVREARDSDSTATVSDVDAPGKGFECYGHAELLDRSQIKLVLVFAIERQKDM
jgi:hypothetical protein